MGYGHSAPCPKILKWGTAVVILAWLAGCSGTTGSKQTTTTNSGSGGISITMNPAPPASMALNATASIAATVSNDSSNAGVDWSCTPSGSCGGFSPAHTASGASTTYTAPGNAENVVIQAASTSDPTITASSKVAISAGASSSTLNSGTFAFYLAGEDSKTQTYALAGSVILDSSGKVTGGEQDYNSVGGATSPEPGADSITGGQLTMGADGLGMLTLVTNNSAVGVSGTETFRLAVVNGKHALIVEFDGSATSSGSIDMQTLSPGGLAQIDGPFVLVVSGKNGTTQEAFGGLLVGDGNGGLHVTIDQNEGGTVTLGSSGHTNVGTYTAPDASGRGTIAFGRDEFVYYVVDTKVIRLLVTTTGTPDIGSAFAGATGVSAATLNSKFYFTDASNLSAGASYVAAGEITADGNGNVSGFADVDENGHATSAGFSGTYTVDSNGYGSITINPGNTQDISHLGVYLTDPTINFSDPNEPADAGVRGLLVDLDSNIIGSGMLIVPPTGTPTLTGNLAFGIQSSLSNKESDAVGLATVSGSSLTGTEELNDLFNTGQDSAVAVSGSLAPDSTHSSRYTVAITATVGAGQQTANYVLYQVSASQVLVVEVDTQFGLGVMEQIH